MNIYQAQPRDVDTILPLYLAYRRFYQVEENLGRAREFILKRLQLNESVIFFAEMDGKAVGFYPALSPVLLAGNEAHLVCFTICTLMSLPASTAWRSS